MAKKKKELTRQAEYQSTLRRRGICPRCGENPLGDKSMCDACRLIHNAACKARYQKKVRFLLDKKAKQR